jgi:hypothetical protein
MTKYRTFGKLDDQFVTEGDTFFTRMNARLRPNQLQPGEVALSKNGRMNEDGTWQTRKGLSTLFGSITTGNDAIRLPWVATSAQRTSGVVTITLDDTPSLSFIPGDNITVDDIDASINGTHALSSVNFNTNTITFADAGTDGTLPVQGETAGNTSVVQTGDSITTTANYLVSNAVRASNVVTLTLASTPGSDFVVSGSIHVDDVDSSVNGTHTITGVNSSAKTITFANTGADTTFTVNGNTVGNTSVASTRVNFTLADDEVNEVYGSAVYSDPNSNSDDYAFTATNNLAIILRLKDLALFKARYESGGETVDGPCGMVQGFDKMYIFRTRKTTLAATPALNFLGLTIGSGDHGKHFNGSRSSHRGLRHFGRTRGLYD